MRPGDNITITSNKIGKLTGVINGWNNNGIKVTLFDSWVTLIRWYDIIRIDIN